MRLYNTKDPNRIINLDTLSEIYIDFDERHTDSKYWRCAVKGSNGGDWPMLIAACHGEDAEEQAREIIKQIKDGYDNGSASITITADTE